MKNGIKIIPVLAIIALAVYFVTGQVKAHREEIEDVKEVVAGEIGKLTDYIPVDKSEEEDENEPVTAGNRVVVSFVDVGQGDCIVIEDNGETMMIDTGYYAEYDNVCDFLDTRNIDEINVLVLTHPDADHIGSAAQFIAFYDVETVYMPSKGKDSTSYGYLEDALDMFEIDTINPEAGDIISFGTATYEVVGPVKDSKYEDANSNSIILRMVNGNDSFLFTGDATGEETAEILALGYDVSADVYKAAHHGSANDGCNNREFIDAVDPDAMVISCKLGNDYGHPHIETMELAQEKGLELFRTDIQGTIVCTSTGDGVTWNQSPTKDFRNGNSME